MWICTICGSPQWWVWHEEYEDAVGGPSVMIRSEDGQCYEICGACDPDGTLGAFCRAPERYREMVLNLPSLPIFMMRRRRWEVVS